MDYLFSIDTWIGRDYVDTFHWYEIIITDLEESRENSPEKYTPNISGGSTLPTPIIEETGIDNETFDVDFPRVFKQMQK